MSEQTPKEAPDLSQEWKCSYCIDEKLVRTIGSILVCPECEVIYVPQPDGWLSDREPRL